MRRKRTTKSKSNVRFDAVVLHFGYVESSAAYHPTTTAPGSHRSAQLQPIRSAGMAYDGRAGRVKILLVDLPDSYGFVSFPTEKDLIGYRPGEV